MKRAIGALAGRRGQREVGYALLMVIFMATILLLMAMAAAPNLLTQGRREREEEMIWRGKQYVRGIKLFYRKMGHFPTDLDDLTKPKMGSLRFMRQAYKDPMNKEDGTWRLLYVGPAGQIIGSLKPNTSPTQISMGASATSTGGFGANAGTMQSPGATAGLGATGLGGSMNPQPTSSSQPTGLVIGGNIIGVASKVNESSIKVYEKGTNYRTWEFYWDPSKDVIGVGQPAAPIGTQPGTPIGAPIGTPLGTPPTGQSPFSPGTQPIPPLSNPPQQNPNQP